MNKNDFISKLQGVISQGDDFSGSYLFCHEYCEWSVSEKSRYKT